MGFGVRSRVIIKAAGKSVIGSSNPPSYVIQIIVALRHRSWLDESTKEMDAATLEALVLSLQKTGKSIM